MQSVVKQIEDRQKKSSVVDVRSGDNVRVHQKIIEGGKERIQIFDGLVIKVSRTGSLSSSFTVRRLSSGVGVEKTFLIHAPNILKIEVTKRSKVRRKYLSYMRGLTGKRARLTGIEFDKDAVNTTRDEAIEAEEAKIKQEQLEKHEEDLAKKAEKKAKGEAKTQKALAEQERNKSEAEKLEERSKERPSAKNPAEEPNKEKKKV